MIAERGLPLTATQWQLGEHDSLTLHDGRRYNSTHVPNAVLSAGEPIYWSSGAHTTGKRWQLCVTGQGRLPLPLLVLLVTMLLLRCSSSMLGLLLTCCCCARPSACLTALAALLYVLTLAADAAAFWMTRTKVYAPLPAFAQLLLPISAGTDLCLAVVLSVGAVRAVCCLGSSRDSELAGLAVVNVARREDMWQDIRRPMLGNGA